jgi:hypothetical protein
MSPKVTSKLPEAETKSFLEAMVKGVNFACLEINSLTNVDPVIAHQVSIRLVELIIVKTSDGEAYISWRLMISFKSTLVSARFFDPRDLYMALYVSSSEELLPSLCRYCWHEYRASLPEFWDKVLSTRSTS